MFPYGAFPENQTEDEQPPHSDQCRICQDLIFDKAQSGGKMVGIQFPKPAVRDCYLMEYRAVTSSSFSATPCHMRASSKMPSKWGLFSSRRPGPPNVVGFA